MGKLCAQGDDNCDGTEALYNYKLALSANTHGECLSGEVVCEQKPKPYMLSEAMQPVLDEAAKKVQRDNWAQMKEDW